MSIDLRSSEFCWRWDLTAMDKLPEYMKLCFYALFNMVHEKGYWVMKEKGLDIVPGLKKEWGNYAKHTLRKQNGSTMDKLPSSKSTWRMVGTLQPVVAFSKSDPLQRGKVAEDKRGCFLTFDALFHFCGIASSFTAKIKSGLYGILWKA
ncbi:hypothetical protein ZIOFF_050654 [Zingiber officinale]|uniref:Terpene synthase metal-binding domain-containing protein n=1 Tax=Zingiber officinale TaxID=94328 RepID=A0A8J5FJA6_ZINOF|nr:hypothetical protein ZIOFF_050654 [Zingiber officinale]